MSKPGRFIANCALLCLSVLITGDLLAQQTSPVPDKDEAVWIWSSSCKGDHILGVTVRLEGKVLYRGALSICQGSRDAEDGRAEFRFHGGHVFQGRFHTRSTDWIEGNIWQAGGEQDVLVLGVSFATEKQILLNTLHVAKPEKQASATLDKGLSITTYPIAGR